jgi:hypothetical protein
MALRLYALVSEQTQKAVELYESRAGGEAAFAEVRADDLPLRLTRGGRRFSPLVLRRPVLVTHLADDALTSAKTQERMITRKPPQVEDATSVVLAFPSLVASRTVTRSSGLAVWERRPDRRSSARANAAEQELLRRDG